MNKATVGRIFVLLISLLVSTGVRLHAAEVIASVGHVDAGRTDLAFSPDGRLVISTDDSVAKIWDRKSGRLIRTLNAAGGHPSFSSDGLRALIGSSIWDLEQGRILRSFGNPASAGGLLSPDGARVITPVSDSPSFALWDTSRSSEIGNINPPQSENFESEAFSTDGRFLVTGGSIDYTKGSVLLWNGKTGGFIRRISAGARAVSAVAISNDARLIAWADPVEISIWDISANELVKKIQNPFNNSFSPKLKFIEGDRLVGFSIDQTVIWDSSNGTALRIAKHDNLHGQDISLDGRWLLTRPNLEGSLQLCDLDHNSTVVLTFGGVTTNIVSLAASETGTVFAGNTDGTIKSWDARTGSLTNVWKHGSAVASLALSSDQLTLASAGGGVVRLWNARTGAMLRNLKAHDSGGPVAFFNDGKQLATSGDNTFSVWDVNSGQRRQTFGKGVDKSVMTADGYYDNIDSIAVGRDQRHIVTGNHDGTISVWNLANGSMRTLDQGGSDVVNFRGIFSVAVSTNGDLISASANGSLKLWRSTPGSSAQILQSDGRAVQFAGFSQDGQQILSGGDDDILTLWDYKSGTALKQFVGHSGAIASASVIRGRNLLATGSYDGTVRFWNIANGALLATSIADSDGNWITITPEGFFAGSPRKPADISIISGFDIYSVDQFYRSLYRPDLVREKLAGDPSGLVREAAARLDLGKAIASGHAPQLTVAPLPSSTGERMLAIEATLTDDGGGIGQVEWRINGAVLGLAKGNGTDRVQTLHKTLALAPGENRIEVVAYNARGFVASTPVQMTVTSTRPASTARPKLYVLAAGVNAYQAAAGLRQLKFAKDDATAVAGALQRTPGRLYDSVEVTTLLDQDVTIAKLDEAFTKLAAKVTPDDVFVLYLSGHGITTDGRFYYIPQDYSYGKAEVTTKAISQDPLQDWFVRIPAQRAALIVDACQSGSMAEDQVTRSGVEQYTGTQHLNEAIGRAVLSATTDDTPAAEGMGGHGAFTYALLEGLTEGDTNKDGVVDIGELGGFVRSKVPELTGRFWHILQAPQVKLSGASFPLAPTSSEPLVAALPDTGPVVLASATHTLTATTVIRQFGDGAAIDIASLDAGTKVRVIQTRGDWDLVAQNGNIIGYVETDKLKGVDDVAPVNPVAPIPDNDTPSNALADYTTRDNRDPDATDLAMLRDMDMPACAASCSKNSQCEAFSYDKWNRVCFLKTAITALRLDPKSMSGIRKGIAIPPTVDDQAKMYVYRNKFFPGDGFNTSKTRSSADCARSCEQNLSCIAYTYYKQTELCRLFKTADKYGENALAESGVKSQSK